TSDYGTLVKANLAAHADGQVVVNPVPASPLSATASFADVDDWGSGFTGYVTLTNTGQSAVNGWTLEFDFKGNITEMWDARAASPVGAPYVVGNADWDAAIAAGQSVSFGFNADWADAQAGPGHYVLNGVALGG